MARPFQLVKLTLALRLLRRKHRLSVNQLAKLTGISRRTLARLENATRGSRSVIREKRTSLLHGPRDTGRGARPVGVSARTAYRLAKALLGEEETERRLEEQTRLSRFLGPDPLYKFLDDLYHYPSFLFHDSVGNRALREEFGDDYRHSLDLLLRSGFGTRNLGARLRAFRMQHDLTLVETADLLDLSKSELHRLERSERLPSPRTRYRILRLLTLPLAGHDFSRADSPAARRASSEGSQACPEQGRGGNPRRVSPPPAAGGPTRSFDSAQDKPARRHRHEPAVSTHGGGARVSSAGLKPRPTKSAVRAEWLAAVRGALAAPPPRELEAEAGPASKLRHLWLAGSLKTKELAAALGVSQSHLIRLLRGDRRPSKRLREQLQAVASRL